MMTREDAIAKAKQLMKDYPRENTVQDLIERAQLEGKFSSNDELLAVWGRLLRFLPQRKGK